ncbi:fibronectin type III domain-containing protein [Nocardioides humilatus]|uniref:Fibronectin type III domain-containing protein n=1 Tax=Nocardioides humilatus TaxID=2607660 RepID=A0A5B1LM23_9ACTN|nr:fibronectin type III domain-containing protein [Nocardioides humilatus]KAA1421138.1 fibronectin type III domain-containing protein [Nocardioides humilatus]
MNRKAGTRLTWLPVLGLVALLFSLPGPSAEARVASLSVTPHTGAYGGTNAHWVVDGLPASQKAWLQRRGSTTSAWADVDNSFYVGTTNARGHLEFDFPTPAMNAVYMRVVTKGGESEGVAFSSKHQDAQLSLAEQSPAEADLPQSVAVGVVVRGEVFTFKADTANLDDVKQKKPVLLGRDVTLQRRTIAGGVVTWTTVATDQVDRDGFADFPNLTGGANLSAGDYRVRLEKWTQDGDNIGWFVSFPFDVSVVDRPLQVLRLAAAATDAYSVKLTWALPADPNRDKIVIARNTGGPANLRQIIATVPGGSTTYTDSTVWPSTNFKYAVYTVSSDGVYVREPVRVDATTPAARQRGEG